MLTTTTATRPTKPSTAPDKLRKLADSLDARSADYDRRATGRLENTSRRAAQASHADSENVARRTRARTLRAVADAIEAGRAPYLARLSNGAQVEALNLSIVRAVFAADRHDQVRYVDGRRDPVADDLRFIEYPWPWLDVGTALLVLTASEGKPGVAELRVAIQRDAADPVGIVHLSSHRRAEAVKPLLEAAPLRDYDKRRWLDTWKDYDRLRVLAADRNELCALALEYIRAREAGATEQRAQIQAARRAQEIRAAERDLIGRKIAGFFSTPKAVAQRLADEVMHDPRRILEPSAGSGALADFANATWPDATVECCEIADRLRKILAMKGHTVVGWDFLDLDPAQSEGYDLVLMNPPFEDGQDMQHVRHAWAFVRANGTLVSVMSAGVRFRSDRATTEFRAWVESLGGMFDDLPTGSFEESGTGTSTCYVTLRK